MDNYKVEKPVLKNFFALMAFVAAVGFTFFFLPSVYLLLVVPVSLTLSLLYLSKEANPISYLKFAEDFIEIKLKFSIRAKVFRYTPEELIAHEYNDINNKYYLETKDRSFVFDCHNLIDQNGESVSSQKLYDANSARYILGPNVDKAKLPKKRNEEILRAKIPAT